MVCEVAQAFQGTNWQIQTDCKLRHCFIYFYFIDFFFLEERNVIACSFIYLRNPRSVYLGSHSPISEVLAVPPFGGSTFHQKTSLLRDGTDIAVREGQETSPLMEVYLKVVIPPFKKACLLINLVARKLTFFHQEVVTVVTNKHSLFQMLGLNTFAVTFCTYVMHSSFL